MERQAVESSQIKSIGFAPSHVDKKDDEAANVFGTLEIEFKGGSVYQYSNVTHEIFAGLMTAESVGSYFGKNIKPFPEKYPFTKIRGTDREEAKKAEQEAGVTA